jgi:hypothetical protein
MATLYKKKSIQDAKSKVKASLTAEETTRVNLVISKFVELFKIKHLG